LGPPRTMTQTTTHLSKSTAASQFLQLQPSR